MLRLVVTYRDTEGKCRQQNYNFDNLGAALNRIAVEKTKAQFHNMELFTLVERWERVIGEGK